LYAVLQVAICSMTWRRVGMGVKLLDHAGAIASEVVVGSAAGGECPTVCRRLAARIRFARTSAL
jgi:hypothetical protein